MRSSGHLGFLLSAILLFPSLEIPALSQPPALSPKRRQPHSPAMRWMPIGMCFLAALCSWSGCRVRTSIKIGHCNPDLVVSSYNELGGNLGGDSGDTRFLHRRRRQLACWVHCYRFRSKARVIAQKECETNATTRTWSSK